MFGIVWTFKTERFRVELDITQDHSHRYDGDDEDGQIQHDLDVGDLVAFDSTVTVYLDGLEIGRDHLGASVYRYNETGEFYTAHRDPDPMNRNCSIMRAERGGNVAIGHYFPDMVRSAIAEARKHLRNIPRIRAA